MTSYSNPGKFLTHTVAHDAEENHNQVPDYPVNSNQSVRRRAVAHGPTSLQPYHHARGGQDDKYNARQHI
jgi:hypothetical protein